MITLDPDFVGSLAPSTKLTTAVNDTHDIPFSRLPRLERLRLQGRADETEVVDDANDGDADKKGQTQSRAEKEKRKMRGKGKSLSRYVLCMDTIKACRLSFPKHRYLRKQRKNVIDPTAVSLGHSPIQSNVYLCSAFPNYRLLYVRNWRSSERRSEWRRRLRRVR